MKRSGVHPAAQIVAFWSMSSGEALVQLADGTLPRQGLSADPVEVVLDAHGVAKGFSSWLAGAQASHGCAPKRQWQRLRLPWQQHRRTGALPPRVAR
jgi:hypothetical protein